MQLFPLMLGSTGRPCLVVGSGDLADAKARVAELAGLHVTRLDGNSGSNDIPTVSNGLAFVTLTQEDAASNWAKLLQKKGYLVNVADQPSLCDFILPAILDRFPVIVAISTSGTSATMARQIRARLEAELPERLGEMVQLIGTARPAVAELLATPDSRRQFWDWATTGGNLCDPFLQETPPSVEAVVAAAADYGTRLPGKIVTVIKLQTSDPSDLTLRGLRRLQQADAVLCVGLKADIAPVAALARRDATLLYDEISTAALSALASYQRSVILLPMGATARAVRIEGAELEVILAGKG
jgi:uroporphyrin-III C-methyltransferase / precorrin-2 dehydrogenase / sirohydrochlorin ferrochelatase